MSGGLEGKGIGRLATDACWWFLGSSHSFSGRWLTMHYQALKRWHRDVSLVSSPLARVHHAGNLSAKELNNSSLLARDRDDAKLKLTGVLQPLLILLRRMLRRFASGHELVDHTAMAIDF